MNTLVLAIQLLPHYAVISGVVILAHWVWLFGLKKSETEIPVQSPPGKVNSATIEASDEEGLDTAEDHAAPLGSIREEIYSDEVEYNEALDEFTQNGDNEPETTSTLAGSITASLLHHREESKVGFVYTNG